MDFFPFLFTHFLFDISSLAFFFLIFFLLPDFISFFLFTSSFFSVILSFSCSFLFDIFSHSVLLYFFEYSFYHFFRSFHSLFLHSIFSFSVIFPSVFSSSHISIINFVLWFFGFLMTIIFLNCFNVNLFSTAADNNNLSFFF